jgi:chitin disaccharide deacetylase
MSRRIWLCADDYGISPGVNRAIRELIENRRLNATSVMVVGPATGRDEVKALKAAVQLNPNCAIGLHATLTAPFRPLTMHFRPLEGGLFLPHTQLLRRGLTGRLDSELVHTELMVQLATFVELFDRPPDFVDGHQHVQIYPGVRSAFLAAVKEAAPNAWIRQCGRDRSWRLDSPKAFVLDVLSAQFRKQAARTKLRFNPAFAGAYDFLKERDFGVLLRQFLKGMPEAGVVMCHPGFVDEMLVGLDPLTVQREREYEFLMGEQFFPLLAANEVALD